MFALGRLEWRGPNGGKRGPNGGPISYQNSYGVRLVKKEEKEEEKKEEKKEETSAKGQFGGDVSGLASQIVIHGMVEALMKLVGEVNWASGEGKSFVETYN